MAGCRLVFTTAQRHDRKRPLFGAVAKWLGNGLQNRPTPVRIRSAPPIEQRVCLLPLGKLTFATPILRSCAKGIALGAIVGLALSFADFGALWLWLAMWNDRALLLMRIAATLVPLGAFVGSAGVLALSKTGDLRSRTLILTTLLSPFLIFVARSLFTGGKMSRLAHRELLVVVAALLILASVAAFVAALFSIHAFAQKRETRIRYAIAAILFVLLNAVTKLDQHFLPNLYGYLHACLALLAYALGLCVAYIVAANWTPRENAVRRIFVAAPFVVALFTAHLATLDSNQNVRVALFDPRASISRSTMTGLAPLFEARRKHEHAHATTQNHHPEFSNISGLPTLPNAHVLLITIDALRADHLGAYGYTRGVSPNIDLLAKDGVVFDHAYTAAPHSSYSISSIMASEYLHETLDLGAALPAQTLARAFNDGGYHTAAFYTLGIFHTEGERLTQYRDDAFGFAFHDHADRTAAELTDRVLEEAARTAHENEKPTFFWAHYFDVHEPYENTSLGTSDMDRYDSELQATDLEIGRLLREIRNVLHNDLVVIVTSDHGEEFRDHGGVYHGSTLYEEQEHVPLIVSAPHLSPRRVRTPVQSIDLAPTMLNLVGLRAPATMRGRDLRAAMTGRVNDMGSAFAAVLQKRMVVHWPFKLIADLRFGNYELFDLENDAHERRNLADNDRAHVASLRGEIYAWLDSVASPAGTTAPVDPRVLALDRGRLGDRRAVKSLLELMRDENAPLEMRTEAARMLGKLADEKNADAIAELLDSPTREISAEAAIALGRMYDQRAHVALRELVHADDPQLRMRAAVSLGRLRDRDAVPALIETLTSTDSDYEREEAIRWLGRLRDDRAVEPLLSLLPEFRTRYLVTVALGEIGDERAFPAMLDLLAWEHRANIRDNDVRGLGLLGDTQAIDTLVTLAATEPDLENVAESLVRLNAISHGAIGGADMVMSNPRHEGFRDCVEGQLSHDWDYAHRTYCETSGPVAYARLSAVPTANHATDIVVMVAAKREAAVAPVEMTIKIGNETLSPVRVEGHWTSYRWTVPTTALSRSPLDAEIHVADPAARILIDHILLVPIANTP